MKSGDVLAEIETDKATMEVEAIDEGVLAKIVVPEGTADVPVNDLIAVIAAEGEDPSSVQAAGGGGKAAPEAKAEAKSEPTSATAPAPADQNTTPGGGHMSYERVNEAPEGAQPGGTAPQQQAGAGGRVFASPLARRIAKQEGVDLAAVEGSGPHGRIIARDVQAAKASGGTKAPAPQAAAEAPKAAAPAPKAAPAGGAPAASPSIRSGASTPRIPTRRCRSTACARPSPSASRRRCRWPRTSISRSIASSTR